MRLKKLVLTALLCSWSAMPVAQELPPGYWPPERTPEVLDLTKTVRLAPSLAELSAGELRAINQLIEAGRLVQQLYEDELHPQALASHEALLQLGDKLNHPPEVQSLLDLYRLFNGPIATTPDNRREAFLPVDAETPARNVYPVDASRGELEAYVLAHPDERNDLLAPRTIVRRATAKNLQQDLDTLRDYPSLNLLHPGLRRQLQGLLAKPDRTQLYAVPQSVHWASTIVRIYQRLNNAARYIEDNDPELAGYLRNRARDLLSDDYESGDAAWVTGNFQRLNVQIGAYETYDDALFGVKAFMSMSILKRDERATKAVRATVGDLQAIEDALPSPQHRRVRGDIPIGVYDVIADFGQSRGRNTATALPNDPLMVKRYGRTILLRENILRSPELMGNAQAIWKALMTSPFDGDLTEDGEFTRTLWHEIGHYLGVDRDKLGRPLEVALRSSADTLEELKADLVALYVAGLLNKAGKLSDQEMANVYASGINRTFLDARPRREQAYQTMELMQFNWLLDKGVLEMDAVNKGFVLHYDRMPGAVAEMLETVLKLQFAGDPAAAGSFIDRWSEWNDDVHEPLAKTIRDSRAFRYPLFRYAALGE